MTGLSGTGSSRIPEARDFSHERRLHWMVMSGQYWTDGMENGAAQAFMSLGIPKEEFLTANAYHYKRATDSIEIVPLPVQIGF